MVRGGRGVQGIPLPSSILLLPCPLGGSDAPPPPPPTNGCEAAGYICVKTQRPVEFSENPGDRSIFWRIEATSKLFANRTAGGSECDGAHNAKGPRAKGPFPKGVGWGGGRGRKRHLAAHARASPCPSTHGGSKRPVDGPLQVFGYWKPPEKASGATRFASTSNSFPSKALQHRLRVCTRPAVTNGGAKVQPPTMTSPKQFAPSERGCGGGVPHHTYPKMTPSSHRSF